MSEAERRYLVVSTDSHVGPSLTRQLRPYCPPQYLQDFDDYALESAKPINEDEDVAPEADHTRRLSKNADGFHPMAMDHLAKLQSLPGLQDPDARLKDMDNDGVAAEVLFAGGQNGEPLPFLGVGMGAAKDPKARELARVGSHIWNQWLADFVAAAPKRFAGVMQVSMWDIPEAVAEIEWAHAAGLRAVNMSAPRRDFLPYSYPEYDRMWDACEDLGLPLVCHVGGGEWPLGTDGPAGVHMFLAESKWMSRRALWQMTLSGVFERHPRLKLVFTEQGVTWVPDTLIELDAIATSPAFLPPPNLLRRPSEYWHSNCYIGASFLAPFEVALRDTVGAANLMWGSDYPHSEGVWPDTRLAMRNTFANAPSDVVRAIIGENAVPVYGFDADALNEIAQRIGPTVEELSIPLGPSEFPEFRGLAFRELGSYA